MARLNRSSEVSIQMDKLKKKVQEAQNRAIVEYGQSELQDIQRRITTAKTDPYARRWAPWSFATRQQRIRQGNVGRGLLYRTGALLRSFRASIRGGTLTISSDLPYSRFLQDGRPNMRPRVIVDLGSKLSQNRLRKILSHNLKRLNK